MSYELVHPIAPRTDVFDEYINEELKNFDPSLIKFNDELNPYIFENDKLKPEVRKVLIRIFNYFMTSIDKNIVIDSVVLTGSIVNYNYNQFSDIDLHILLNKNDYDTIEEYNQIYELLTTKSKLWNFEHENLKLHDHHIEIYIQEHNEPHKSSGVYDIISDKWLIKPNKISKDIDIDYIKNKLEYIVNKIEDVLKTDDINKLENFIDSLKKYRKKGLNKGGEYAPENIIYKYIKHYGYMEKLLDLKRKLSI
jgi:predicted nucleotidyltransferase